MINFGNMMGAGAGFGMFAGWLGMFLVPVLVWSLAWKGWALWKAAKNDSPVWFIVLLLVNTVGILDILYIFVFGSDNQKSVKTVKRLVKKSGRK
jgi:hypothetical protein